MAVRVFRERLVTHLSATPEGEIASPFSVVLLASRLATSGQCGCIFFNSSRYVGHRAMWRRSLNAMIDLAGKLAGDCRAVVEVDLIPPGWSRSHSHNANSSFPHEFAPFGVLYAVLSNCRQNADHGVLTP